MGLELIYFLPVQMAWWILLVLGLAAVFVLWIGDMRLKPSTWLLLGELVWVLAAGVGFLVFSLLSFWQAELVIAIILALSGWIVYWHQEHIDSGRWSLTATVWLSFFDLVTLFVFSAALIFAVQFYNLAVFWLMVGVALELGLALYLVFWRQGLSVKKFWLYAILLALIGQQLMWTMNPWHRGAYFKAFLLLMVYYLNSNFLPHYLKGNLTVKVAFEYIGIAVFLVVVLFVFDLLFLIVPNV